MPIFGGGSTVQAAPDYRGAAQEQAAASKEIATQQNYANRPAQFTPWGSTQWGTTAGVDPSTGQAVTNWSQTQQLNPQLQGALDKQLGLTNYRTDLASQFAGRVGQDYGQPFDWTNLPALSKGPGVQDYGAQRQRIEEALYSRMEPVHMRQEDQLRTRLANQGLTQGSEAFTNEMQRMREAQANERFNAMQTAGQEQQRMFGMDTEASNFANRVRQQAIAEQTQQRNMSLNELNALLYGQQVSPAQMPSFMPAAASQAPQYLQAAGMQGQYQLGQQQAAAQENAGLWGGLGQLGGSAAALYALGAFSDIRLKSNIRRIGTHPIGVGIYEYTMFGQPEIGVIAQELQEVRPDLVSTHPSGYLMVNYGGL